MYLCFFFMKRGFMRRKKSLFLLGILFILSVFSVGFYREGDKYFEIAKNIDIFSKLLRTIDLYFVDEIEPNRFVREGIDGMLRSLDPYTNFIGSSEIEDFRFMSTGKYGGIGAVIQRRGDYVIISEPYENSPAYKAGIRAGDTLMQIEDFKVYKIKDLSKIRDLLRGQPGTKVHVKIKRYGKAALEDVVITRENIKVNSVPYHTLLPGKIGYIRLQSFTQNATQEVRSAVLDLKSQAPELRGIILDLRGNPGGLLMEAVGISNLFVDKGEKIVETKGRMPSANNIYYATSEPLDLEIPLVVCINQNSASASEIVSGVMKDLDRGVIVGRKSYGKGLVQVTKPLSYNTQVKLTIARYYTPSGRCIQKIQYSHDGKKGTTVLPDSLRKEFTTRAGRKVLDAGGIEPDSLVPQTEYHPITRHLLSKNIVFDFATYYYYKHNGKIPSANEFKLSEEEYREFVRFAKRHPDYDYKPPLVNELEALDTLLRKEVYYDKLKKNVEELQKTVEEHIKNDILHYKKEIIPFLEQEIVGRTEFRKGKIAKSLETDKDIKAASYFLTHPEAYKKVLKK